MKAEEKSPLQDLEEAACEAAAVLELVGLFAEKSDAQIGNESADSAIRCGITILCGKAAQNLVASSYAVIDDVNKANRSALKADVQSLTGGRS